MAFPTTRTLGRNGPVGTGPISRAVTFGSGSAIWSSLVRFYMIDTDRGAVRKSTVCPEPEVVMPCSGKRHPAQFQDDVDVVERVADRGSQHLSDLGDRLVLVSTYDLQFEVVLAFGVGHLGEDHERRNGKRQ